MRACTQGLDGFPGVLVLPELEFSIRVMRRWNPLNAATESSLSQPESLPLSPQAAFFCGVVGGEESMDCNHRSQRFDSTAAAAAERDSSQFGRILLSCLWVFG